MPASGKSAESYCSTAELCGLEGISRRLNPIFCGVTLGSRYVVVMAGRDRVLEGLFSTRASDSKRFTMKSSDPGSQEDGRASSNCTPLKKRSGEVRVPRT